MDADDVISHLELAPLLVEGGHFRQYWRSREAAERPDGTAIVALLTDAPDGFSQFHRLTGDEIWRFYLGDPAELVLLEGGARSRHLRLGNDLHGGDHVVAVVPADTWMAARTMGRWSLVGNTMAPGFTRRSTRRCCPPAGPTRRRRSRRSPVRARRGGCQMVGEFTTRRSRR